MPLLHVTSVDPVTPRLRRVRFTGDGLDDLPTWPDQQLRLLFPRDGHPVPDLPADRADKYGFAWHETYQAIPEARRPWLRTYTVRAHHPDSRSVDVDFALHDPAGPAGRWALHAKPGDTIGRYGPTTVQRRPLRRADRYLFAGDETALPAIATLLESLPGGTSATAYVEVRDAAEEQPLPGIRWVHRDTAPPGDALLDAVRAASLPPGPGFAWLGGEAATVRILRRHLVDDRDFDPRSIASGTYWRRGLTQDDDPTPDDVADARERVAY